jgi:trans-aconitate methyltransferase
MSVNPDVLKQYNTADALTTRRSLYDCIVGPTLSEILARYLQLDKSKTLLDVGCGYGADIATFTAQYPGLQATGLDSSPKLIEDARTRAPGAVFHVADAANFALEEKYDRILVRHVLHLLDVPGAAITNILKYLNPSGRAVFVMHSTRSQPRYAEWLTWFLAQTGIDYISPSDAFTVDTHTHVFTQQPLKVTISDATQIMRMREPEPYLAYLKSQKRWSREPLEAEMTLLLSHVRQEIEKDIAEKGYFEDASINGIVVLER